MGKTLSTRFREWKQTHLSPLKIDFMSLNRLRLNQNAESIFEGRESYTHASIRGSQNLSVWSRNGFFPFSAPKIILNPYGTTPLTACVIFDTEEPCRLSYTVRGKIDFSYTTEQPDRHHVLLIHGLYPAAENHVVLTLTDSGGQPVGQKELTIPTDSLPEHFYDENQNPLFPCIRDDNGEVRYYLSIPAGPEDITLLQNGHLLIVDREFMTINYKNPSPTHIHEVGLNGYVYRTYYVGTGIQSSPFQPEDNDVFLFLSEPSDKGERYMEVDCSTGAVTKFHNKVEELPAPFVFHKDCFKEDAYKPEETATAESSFTTLGWLNSPGLHKGASIQTVDTISAEQLQEQYGVNAFLMGDTLCIRMGKDVLQEILFSKFDIIYQMDLSPYIEKERPEVDAPYTIAVPLTEMHSGTYTLVLRFVNGGQAVISDALMLSRRRNS